uniref:Uncharacterized protein n=1 Tax=Salix viminalis TaxID=40686 RepID=A0A6N2MDA9_SALVM
MKQTKPEVKLLTIYKFKSQRGTQDKAQAAAVSNQRFVLKKHHSFIRTQIFHKVDPIFLFLLKVLLFFRFLILQAKEQALQKEKLDQNGPARVWNKSISAKPYACCLKSWISYWSACRSSA